MTMGQLSASRNEIKLTCHQLAAVLHQSLYAIVYKQMKRSRQNFKKETRNDKVPMGISAKVEEVPEKESSENGDLSKDENSKKPYHKYPTSSGGSGSGPGGAPG